MRFSSSTILTVSIGLLLSGCVTQTVTTTGVPTLKTLNQKVPNAEILDLAVVIFDPGISAMEEEPQVFPEIRKAEATFMARELAQVLDNQGAWGATRVVPSGNYICDLTLTGRIVHSDGESLALAIKVTDATNRIWLDREFSGNTSRYAYETIRRSSTDPFLGIYREIANELLKLFLTVSPSEREKIRQVSQLRFAQIFAPDAFNEYLQTDENNHISLLRLPAADDPMVVRIGNIRKRDDIFVDTLQGHYENFSGQMLSPYNEWRKLGYDETVSLRQLKKESRDQLIAGSAAVIAGIATQGSENPYARAAGAVGVWAGGSLVKSGLERRAEADIHSVALEELGQSLEAEVTPNVIELEDRTIQLTGSVNDQYDQWREILGDIYAAELPEDQPVTKSMETDDTTS